MLPAFHRAQLEQTGPGRPRWVIQARAGSVSRPCLGGYSRATTRYCGCQRVKPKPESNRPENLTRDTYWHGLNWPSRLQGMRDVLGPLKAEAIWAEGSRLTLYEAAALAASERIPSAG